MFYYKFTKVMSGPAIHQVKNQYCSKGLLPNIIRISSIKLLKPARKKNVHKIFDLHILP
jgi:hypothetical protein